MRENQNQSHLEIVANAPRQNSSLLWLCFQREIALAKPRCLLLAGLVCIASVAVLDSSYRPLEMPAEWRFSTPVTAYSPETGEAMGDFQPGVRVKVMEEYWQQGQWLVAFRRFGQADIIARVAIPSLADQRRDQFRQVQSSLESFPLLHRLMESKDPWPQSTEDIAAEIFSGGWTRGGGSPDEPGRIEALDPQKDAHAWSGSPLAASLDYSVADHPRIVLEFWNKGDAHRTRVHPAKAYESLRGKLIELENAFGTWRGENERRGQAPDITALRRDAEYFFLPNDIQAILRYRTDEYLLLELTSFRKRQQAMRKNYDPDTFAATLQSHVTTHADGYRYISGIPMITQGDKGYCAAATLARVFNFYGFPVDMHAIAELAETEGHTGTSLDNILSAMQRICNSTPFRMNEVRNQRRANLLEAIERGIPMIWLVPGHMRLLIGVDPEGGIVYSDSWGPGHEFKTMSWNEFINLNRGLYRLDPS